LFSHRNALYVFSIMLSANEGMFLLIANFTNLWASFDEVTFAFEYSIFRPSSFAMSSISSSRDFASDSGIQYFPA
ncbi:MAG: hypothetical protein IK021_04525, partial [Methanobrevibacter sp.]|nr:hypothetical protein [Methanobrevibacter sp.]